MSEISQFPRAGERSIAKADAAFLEAIGLQEYSFAAAVQEMLRLASDVGEPDGQAAAVLWLGAECGMRALIEDGRNSWSRAMIPEDRRPPNVVPFPTPDNERSKMGGGISPGQRAGGARPARGHATESLSAGCELAPRANFAAGCVPVTTGCLISRNADGAERRGLRAICSRLLHY